MREETAESKRRRLEHKVVVATGSSRFDTRF